MTKSDRYIWKVEEYLLRTHGVTETWRMLDPLQWYINTGRASVTFLHLLYDVKPYCIGKILAKGGSHDEVIRKIRKRIGLPEINF
jgi:hypothetical protein